VFKGMKMAGRKGSGNVTAQNLEIVDIDKENNLLYVKGAIPGPNNTPVFILKK
jgi:large subunit ribosomal protein L3